MRNEECCCGGRDRIIWPVNTEYGTSTTTRKSLRRSPLPFSGKTQPWTLSVPDCFVFVPKDFWLTTMLTTHRVGTDDRWGVERARFPSQSLWARTIRVGDGRQRARAGGSWCWQTCIYTSDSCILFHFSREQEMTSSEVGFRVLGFSGLAWEKLDRMAGVYILCVCYIK